MAQRFRLHFNRIAMQRGDPRIWSLQLSGQCIHAREVICHVPLQTQYRPEKRQNPRAFLTGRGIITHVGDKVVIV